MKNLLPLIAALLIIITPSVSAAGSDYAAWTLDSNADIPGQLLNFTPLGADQGRTDIHVGLGCEIRPPALGGTSSCEVRVRIDNLTACTNSITMQASGSNVVTHYTYADRKCSASTAGLGDYLTNDHWVEIDLITGGNIGGTPRLWVQAIQNEPVAQNVTTMVENVTLTAPGLEMWIELIIIFLVAWWALANVRLGSLLAAILWLIGRWLPETPFISLPLAVMFLLTASFLESVAAKKIVRKFLLGEQK